VFAQDKGTGHKQSIRISNTGGLSTLEVERMRQEAQIYSDHDRKQQEIAQLRNNVDSLIYSYTSTIRENGSRVSSDLQASALALIDEIKIIAGQSDLTPEMLRQKTDQFQQLLLQIGSLVYQSPQDLASVSTFTGRSATEGTHSGSETNVSWSDIDGDSTFVGSSDIDETIITDYEVVD
jgi:molecular chaperone DnaK